MKNKILYISLTGMGEALGKSQVLEYLKGLSDNNKFFLVSFEKKYDLSKINSINKEMKDNGIEWKYFIYSNKFGVISTLIQIIKASIYSFILSKKYKIDIVHARSMIPALMSYPLKLFLGVKFLFDIRDFSTDEKVDRSRIKNGSILYRILLYLEIFLYKKSDAIVALTESSKIILHNRYKIKLTNIYVISTCANKNIFFPVAVNDTLKKNLNIPLDRKILLHSGSVTGWYLFDEEISFYKKMKKIENSLLFLVLNEHAHDYIKHKMKNHGIAKTDYKIMSIPFKNMNLYLNISDLAIFFIKPTYSKIASAPTKFAEYVAAQLPSIANLGIGDMEMYMKNFNVGHIVDIGKVSDFDIKSALELLKNPPKKNYNTLFKKYLDRDKAVMKYNEIYTVLIGKSD